MRNDVQRIHNQRRSNPESTVRVARTVDASANAVWKALIDPAHVARWMGTLSGPIRADEQVRIDFGDGDFFELEVARVDPPSLLQYAWRFLGIGPINVITWTIEAQDRGCKVVVQDEDPERSPAAAEELRTGWLDFTRRLVQYVHTGEATRYDWRRSFEGSIEVSGTPADVWKYLFGLHQPQKWMPLQGKALTSGSELVLADGGRPDQVRIDSVEDDEPHQLAFTVGHATWGQCTSVQFTLTPRRQGTLLRASHTGWAAIRPDEAEQKWQRKRFSALWIGALRKARALVEQELGSGDGG